MKNIYFFLITVWFSFFSLMGFSQINQGGTPFSFQNPQLVKSAVPVVQMPKIDLNRLMAEDSLNDQIKDIPWRFGENIYVNLNPINSGTWDLLPKGDKLWRLRIRCQSAYTINLTFDNYHLPFGATLFVYNADRSQVIGAFTDFNNQSDRIFATTLVKGEEITIEYYEPANPSFPGEINLYRVTHGYRDAYGYAKSFGSSGSCENNVACPEAAGWENQIKSVCMLVSGGSGFCSGAIVNNTSQNGVPYILTANHCYSDPSSWVFWFNWQSPTCANPGSSPSYNSISGATLKAKNSASDFCLVQMTSTPPSGYGVYYAGWNRENVAATSGAGIHHPAGDIKKISYSTTAFTSDAYGGVADSHWKVVWSDGVTEGGSSGSPIFDQNHRIVGQLHGGPSVCGGGSLWDFYGKFSMSWDYGSTSSTRLKDWLDPTNISGNTLNGWDPNGSLTLTVTPSDQAVAAAPGTTTFTVTTTAAWTATSNQSWCTVTPSGSGNGTITATYTQNTGSLRVANVTVTVSGLTPVVVTVTQAAPTLSVTPSNQNVTSAAGSTTFSVTSNSAWTCSSNQSWCTVTLSGSGNGTITATYTQNLSGARVANITVTVPGLIPVVVIVTQAGYPTLAVIPSSQAVSSAAGSAIFNVSSNSNWTCSSDQTWCVPTASGSGNGTITATYTSNTSFSPRIANLTVSVSGISPVVVNVIQAGATPTLTVIPANQSVPYIAGNTSFSVASNTDWTASSDQTWCTVTPSGSGNGTITATYLANTTYVPRIANITVTVSGLSPVVVTVTQASAPVPEFNYTIVNDVQTSDRKLEFDLYLLNTQPSTPFELSSIQAGILVNSGIIGAGTITVSLLPGYSELVELEQPTTITWVTGTPNGCIKIAARVGPGCGYGTIIGTTGLGTRVCRVRITNSVPFTASSQANLAFNFTITPYPTKVFRYSGTPCSGHELTTNSTNCFSLAANPIMNGPHSLSVSPSNQPVSSSAGTVPFTVTSNASWTASSNQSWCTVTSSGFGTGTITATYTENTNSSPRVANVTVTVSGLTPVVVTVSQEGASSIKTFNLTVFLQGLYIGSSTMHPVMDGSGYHWGATIADKLTIELHDGSNYSTIVYTATNVSLNTNGTVSFTMSSSYNGNYYVTIRHRNHILTTSALPVSFSPSTINYNFDAPGKAFGDNMLMMYDGKYVVYAGDVNQDRLVDGSDLNQISNQNDVFAIGYLVEDINGDGLVDGTDLNITSNNNDMFIAAITP